jgi:hypothetical protein
VTSARLEERSMQAFNGVLLGSNMVRIWSFRRPVWSMLEMALLMGAGYGLCIPTILVFVGVQSRIWQIQPRHMLGFVVLGR